MFRVEISMNLVRAIAPHETRPGEIAEAASNLEIGTMAAVNFQRNGCLDGTYYFADLARARTFARLCLEFMRLLVERRLADLAALPPGKTYFTDLSDD